ncbi:hypothetical protein WA026_021115 [Henosepilachna vigintioctopunctata]|uniref:Uncharacterized protein n=1 Tax=Henosepilachna vigintioctopunctata TaxID=420089 RepID=A0AAW1V1N7_9CUCU
MDKEADTKNRKMVGHGSFAAYTHRIGKTENELCVICGVPDNPEHVVYNRTRWNTEREGVTIRTGPLHAPEVFLSKMIEERSCWNSIFLFIAEAMKRKEREDRIARKEVP